MTTPIARKARTSSKPRTYTIGGTPGWTKLGGRLVEHPEHGVMCLDCNALLDREEHMRGCLNDPKWK